MQIHPLVTVKKASAVLGIDKDVIRERLGSGQMKGEKRRVGEKEKWFLYHGEVENWLEKQRLPEQEQTERITTDGMSDLFEAPSAAPLEFIQLVPLEPLESLESVVPADESGELVEYLQVNELIELLESAAVQTPLADLPTVSVEATYSVQTEDLFLHQIVEQFADRLAKEQYKNIKLEIALQAQSASITRIGTLSDELNSAKIESEMKNLEISRLNEHLTTLEAALAKAKMSFWQKLFQ